MVDSPHGKEDPFAIRSRPVGYAAEYLTRGTFAAIPLGRFPLMFIYCILYHFWDVRRILLPPLRQFSHTVANQLSSSHSQLNSSIVQDSAFRSPTQSSSPVLSRPHFSHLATPTLTQPSPSPGPILPFTSDIQSSLSLLSSPASPPSDDSAPSSSASSSSMLGRSLFSSFGNAWLNS